MARAEWCGPLAVTADDCRGVHLANGAFRGADTEAGPFEDLPRDRRASLDREWIDRVTLSEDVLPLMPTCLYLPPYWMSPGLAIART